MINRLHSCSLALAPFIWHRKDKAGDGREPKTAAISLCFPCRK